MSTEHVAQVLAEMLNDENFRKRVASDPSSALAGWILTDEERTILIEEARGEVRGYDPRSSPGLAYIARTGPVSQPTGTALGNALNRATGAPVTGPLAGSCDAGCCSWAARFSFQARVR